LRKPIRQPERVMPALARKPRPDSRLTPSRQPSPQSRRKVFHATLLVTRAEEWWVEAETLEEAQALLAAGDGHHAALGACVHVEVEGILDDAK
jgi:hypothetical protein